MERGGGYSAILYMKFIIGRKLQMTQVFDESGAVHPVTVVAMEPMTVSQIRTNDKDGYDAVQVAYGQGIDGIGMVNNKSTTSAADDTVSKDESEEEKKSTDEQEVEKEKVSKKSAESKTTTGKPEKKEGGRKNKNKHRREFRGDSSGFAIGRSINVADVFSPEDIVRVTATSKGKGFQGVVKRYGFAGGPRTHGQKHNERQPGSIGSGLRSRVPKGTKMPGRMGNDTVTVKGDESGVG